ncbi:outer membrane beta-barrel protein [Anaerophaga thermohalophila]|jgi:hypothetical protein|uniref:outer membrane beta-barrel protein n=1 Tax=Anaerophaga thermohalophila TaxID=177400 RepID=UPI00031F02B2|nr:outer membrane beta-barrel protein [Anaerophaga thermohalophila]
MIKRSFIAFIFLAAFVITSHAQYTKENWIISPKISFADYSDKNNWEGYSISKIPPVSFFAEKGVNSFFSAGGFLGYNRDKYTNDTIPQNVMRYSTFMAGAVATIHYAHWIESLSGYSIFLGDFDFYASASFQLAFSKTNEQNFWNSETEDFSNHESNEVNFRIRPILGIRYFLTDRFCMLLEAGKGNPGMITTGVSWFLGN